VLLAAESLGYRAKIVSGAHVASGTMRAAFALTGSEHLVGFVAISSFQGNTKETPRRLADQVLSAWTAPDP
jgi:hypothetical protein